MFAMLTGGWPRITGDGVALARLEADAAAGVLDPGLPADAVDALVREVVALQIEAGLEPVTDGGVRWADAGRAALDAALGREGPRRSFRDAWRATAALTDLSVIQALPGPYSTARRLVSDPADRERATLALADWLGGELRALADGGCPVVEVEEPAAVAIGDDASERRLFAEAQRRLLAGAPDLHAMLSITGGNATATGGAVLFDAPYRSYLFDLVAGPDNWVLARQVPAERGIVCGALGASEDREDPLPLLVWAARYAASMGGRGLERVGLANASSLWALSPAAAAAKVRALGRAARLATMPLADAVEAGLDPRTVGSRMAAVGPRVPRPRRRRGAAHDGTP